MNFKSSIKKLASFAGSTVVGITAGAILDNLTNDIPAKNAIHAMAIKAGTAIIVGMISAASSKYISNELDDLARDVSVINDPGCLTIEFNNKNKNEN